MPGIVWYNESGMRPTRDGDLLIHQSATNRIIRVKIGD